MIIGIGIDIIEVSRIERLIHLYGKHFLHRIFTEDERKYCSSKHNSSVHYSGKFAGKESVLKALGTGLSKNIRWKDIEIISEKSGQPYVKIYGNARKILQNLGEVKIHISISHTRKHASAITIIEDLTNTRRN